MPATRCETNRSSPRLSRVCSVVSYHSVRCIDHSILDVPPLWREISPMLRLGAPHDDLNHRSYQIGAGYTIVLEQFAIVVCDNVALACSHSLGYSHISGGQSKHEQLLAIVYTLVSSVHWHNASRLRYDYCGNRSGASPLTIFASRVRFHEDRHIERLCHGQTTNHGRSIAGVYRHCSSSVG